MTVTRHGGVVVHPAGGQLPESHAVVDPLHGEKLARRAGRHVFIVDDSLLACGSAEDILRGPFQGRVGSATDPVEAEGFIADRVSKGQLHVLVLDMDMPKVSGRQLALNLARRNIYPAIVVLSGGQGAVETTAFLAQLTGARSSGEYRDSVDRYFSEKGDSVFYVAKEDVALRPELLLHAVDAALAAAEGKVERRDLAFAAIMPAPTLAGLPKGDLGDSFARIADDALAIVGYHRRRVNELRLLMDEIKPTKMGVRLVRGADSVQNQPVPIPASEIFLQMETHLSDSRKFSYPELCKIRRRDELTDLLHDLRGSQGMLGALSILSNLQKCYEGGDLERLRRFTDGYRSGIRDLLDTFTRHASELIGKSYVKPVDLNPAVSAIAQQERVPVLVHGDMTLDIDGDLLGIALKQALVNARHAAPSEQVNVSLRQIKLSELGHSGLREHFTGRGLALESDVVEIAVCDKGIGFVPSVMEAWNNRETIVNPTSGQPTMGLSLMRRTAESINDGAVLIDSSPSGSVVAFYFVPKAKQSKPLLEG